jgi:hypothetical protein
LLVVWLFGCLVVCLGIPGYGWRTGRPQFELFEKKWLEMKETMTLASWNRLDREKKRWATAHFAKPTLGQHTDLSEGVHGELKTRTSINLNDRSKPAEVHAAFLDLRKQQTKRRQDRLNQSTEKGTPFTKQPLHRQPILTKQMEEENVPYIVIKRFHDTVINAPCLSWFRKYDRKNEYLLPNIII